MENKNKTYQYLAGLQESTGEIIYSRANHDFIQTTDGQGFMDGGQLGLYNRHSGLKIVVIDLPVSYGEAYDDWNNRTDKYGRINPEDAKNIRIVPKEEWIDRKSFEFKKYTLWGTYGKDSKGPKRTKCLCDCETDHLQAILDTQTHIGNETRQIIQSILADREDMTLEEFKTKPLDEVADFFQRKTGVSDETREKFKRIMEGARKQNESRN